jgi:uncharacterized membrane protein YgcG
MHRWSAARARSSGTFAPVPLISRRGPARSDRRSTAATLHRIATAVGLALAAVVAVAGAAVAEPPTYLADQVTDHAGVLGGVDADVTTALDELTQATGYQLFVVYVDSFDGLDRADWADQTAELSGFGTDDILLAVAVDDGLYQVSVDEAIALTDAQLADVESDAIEPALHDGDWSGAIVAAAEGYADAAGGGGSGNGWVVGVVIAVVVGVVVVGVVLRRRRPAGHETESLPDLEGRANAALLAADEAVQASGQELGFAQAQFGATATQTFDEVLGRARTTLAAAFAIRQRLDDDERESKDERRELLGQVLDLCDDVDEALDAQAAAFAELRDLHARAPQLLTELDQRATEVAGRLPAARAALDALAVAYAPTALATVQANADQAATLLDHARQAVTGGTAALDTDRASAVELARVAEDCVRQAGALLDAIGSAGADLAAAPARIAAAVTSLGADLDDAARLAPQDPTVAAVVGEANAARTAAADLRPAGDPLAVLAGLVAAETRLDALLAPLRAHEENVARARTRLVEAVPALRGQIATVTQLVELNREAVGVLARTRLAEAQRHLDTAAAAVEADPLAAMAWVQEGTRLVGEAHSAAGVDIARARAAEDSRRAAARRSADAFGGEASWGSSSSSSSSWGGWGGSGGSSGGSSRRSSSSSRRSSSSSGRSSSSRRSSSSGRSSGRRGGGGRF